jgi:hypothetical protein
MEYPTIDPASINSKTPPQVIVNTVMKLLYKQNQTSHVPNMTSAVSRSGSVCKYRGPGGLKCGAGMILTDKEYTSDMEGRAFDAIPNFPSRLSAHVQLIRALQQGHDMCVHRGRHAFSGMLRTRTQEALTLYFGSGHTLQVPKREDFPDLPPEPLI